MAVPQFPNFILPTDSVPSLVSQVLSFSLGLMSFSESNKALKGHIHISLFFYQELPFPFQRFSLGGKAALELLLAFALSIGVTELNIPGSIVLIFERCHNYFSFLSVSDLVP